MFEALAQFQALIERSQIAGHVTDPTAYFLAVGLFKVTHELNERLAEIEQTGRENNAKLIRIEAGLQDLKQRLR